MGEIGTESPKRPKLGEAKLPVWIWLWFIVDAIIAMAPPAYWLFSEPAELVAGIPNALLYFLVVGTIISASIIAAYLVDAHETGDGR